MSDFLQLIALLLFPLGAFIITLAFLGLLPAVGILCLAAIAPLWLIGRESSLAKIEAAEAARQRALETGWSDEERQRLELGD